MKLRRIMFCNSGKSNKKIIFRIRLIFCILSLRKQKFFFFFDEFLLKIDSICFFRLILKLSEKFIEIRFYDMNPEYFFDNFENLLKF